MAIAWSDIYNAVRSRNWPIHEAWALVQESTAGGAHPEVHVAHLADSIDADVHFRTQTDFQGNEYRDRGRHSMFKIYWEAVGALCMAMNTPAGDGALLAIQAGGRVALKSRSAVAGGLQALERLQIAVHGTVTGVSFFDLPAEFAVIILDCSGGNVVLRTAYPSRGASDAPPPGRGFREEWRHGFHVPGKGVVTNGERGKR
jgi:hypothetical protein